MPITIDDIRAERARRQQVPSEEPVAAPLQQPEGSAPSGISLADIQAERQRRQAPQSSIGPMAFGAVQGVSDVLGAPLDLAKAAAEYGLSKLPEAVAEPTRYMLYGEEAATMPAVSTQLQDAAKGVLEKVGVPAKDLDPDTAAEQFIQRVVREVTGSVVGIPAVRALSASARALPIGSLALGEAGMGAAQGVGAATMQQIAPDNLPAELVGQLAPNVVSLTRALARQLGTRLVPDPEMLRTQVQTAIQETMGDVPQAASNVDKAAQLSQQIPGFQPTLAEATLDPGLLAMQRSQRVSDPRLAAMLSERRLQNIDAVTDSLSEMFEGGDIGQVRQALGQRYGTEEKVISRYAERAQQRLQQVTESTQARAARAQARINERVQLAQSKIRKATSALADTDIDAVQAQELASGQARKLYDQARKTFRTESRRLYENVDPDNAVNGRVGDLYDQAKDLELRALAQFDQRDLPRSLQDFKRSLSARASKPEQPAESLFPVGSPATPDDQLELQQFIRRKGGINLGKEEDIGSEFEAMIRKKESGASGLFRVSGGLTPERMAEAAAESGFIFEGDKVELLDAIRESMKSGKTYSFKNASALGDPIDTNYLIAGTVEVPDDMLREVNVSLSDLQRLRSHVLRESRQLTGPDAGNARRLLHDFRGMVESRMESLARDQGRTDILDKLDTANRFYRQNVTKFSTGAGEKILRQKNGRYMTSNAHVIREFLKSPEDAAQFVDGIGSRDAALGALEQYMDAELYLRAVNPETGRLSASQARRFLRERDPMLRMFPELQERYGALTAVERKVQRIEDLGKRLSTRETRRVDSSEELAEAQEYAANAQASAQMQQQRLAREPGQAILQNTLDSGGIAQLMGRQDANTQLIRVVDQIRDNPEARKGIGKAMWQEFVRREGARTGRDAISDNPVIADKSLQNFLNRYGSTLQHIYGAEHVANLRKVSEGLRIARAADKSPTQLGSPTAELLQSNKGFLSQAAGVALPISMPLADVKLRLLRFAGRQVINYIATKRQDALDTLTREMLYDPDISKTMAMLRDPAKAKTVGVRLKAHMLMLGADNRFDDPEGEE